jgi:hypothetical protein
MLKKGSLRNIHIQENVYGGNVEIIVFVKFMKCLSVFILYSRAKTFSHRMLSW